jgi:perosamine synthetase
MCTTNNADLDDKMRVLRDHGMSKSRRYWHDVVGYNYRMTNLQAAIGLAQLERIDTIHKNRKKYEESYKALNINEIAAFQEDIPNHNRITWLVSVLLKDTISREEFIASLKAKGIDVRPFFYPLSDMNIYKEYCQQYTKVTHEISKRGVNLPTYESLKSLEEIKTLLSN